MLFWLFVLLSAHAAASLPVATPANDPAADLQAAIDSAVARGQPATITALPISYNFSQRVLRISNAKNLVLTADPVSSRLMPKGVEYRDE